MLTVAADLIMAALGLGAFALRRPPRPAPRRRPMPYVRPESAE